MNNKKLLLVGTGRMNRHGVTFSFRTEILYTCPGCNAKITPQEARWVGDKTYCPVCRPELTKQEE